MKKTILFYFFFLLMTSLSAQNNNVLRVTKIPAKEGITLDKFWKFHNGDDSAWASPSFDDSGWDTVNTSLKFDKNHSSVFKGIGWFRIHIYIDPSFNDTALCLLMNQEGASQLFLDGKLMHSFGTVSADLKNEIKYNPLGVPVSFLYGKAGEYVLSVRYSNLNYKKNFEKYDADKPGFKIQIAKLDDSVIRVIDLMFDNTTIIFSLGMFFLTLAFVHLLFFLFYRKQRSNLFYSIFVFIFGLIFIMTLFINNTTNPELALKLQYYWFFLIPLFFYSLLALQYTLFRQSFGNYFWVTSIFFIILIVTMFLGVRFEIYLAYSFVISTVAASFSIVIKSILRKLDGAWIIGTGTLMFLILAGTMIISIMFTHQFTGNSPLFAFSVLFSIISIPVSMSIYLARESGRTNSNLEKQLIEVESLSAKSIEQEKEKQKFLENQKEVLEVQVKERTIEIVEQKKVIEEKNKDITDSISYAKRIQDAILPDPKLLGQHFPSSFILFKPKDIVSGDFYWFGEKNGKKIIIAADCTGHGVPGSLMSMIGSNILNHLIIERAFTKPDDILNHLHKEIRIALKQNDENAETRDGMDIAVVTIENNSLQYSGAHRPLWIVKQINNEKLVMDNSNIQHLTSNIQQLTPNNNLLHETKGNKFSIGGIQEEEERIFTNHVITLEKNDSIYIFSDGFADQFSPQDKKLMTKKFQEILISIQHKTMEEQKEYLDSFIENWKGKMEQTDDILVIGLKI